MTSKNTEDILNGALADFAESFAENEAIAEIIKQAQNGEIDEGLAMAKLMETVIGNPQLQSQLMEQAMTSLAPVAPTDLVPADTEEQLVESYSATYQPPSGLPRKDPLLEAAITERLQFDGDAPELRNHAIGEGIRPAVPVLGAPINPVALGWSLERASDDVLSEIKALTEKVSSDSTELVEANSETGLATQPAGFKPGQLPALRETEGATGAQLIALPAEKQQQLAWGSFSTTQGRRSAAPGIAELIADYFEEHFDAYNTKPGPNNGQMSNSEDGIVAKAVWVMNITGSGPLTTQTGFNIMGNAATALAKQLSEELYKTKGKYVWDGMTIEVCTVDTYERRQVGWAALLRE